MVLVFGKNGQVARALASYRPDDLYLSSQEAPFTDTAKVLAHLDKYRPQIVINAAAYTAVDKAETEKELSLQINAKTPGEIAQWCKKNNATLIHFSTDYVFDGTGEKPWVETDVPNPINWYGHTKLEGEKAIQASGCIHSIFRISWVYSEWGHNFRNTIRRLVRERKELKVVNDQWGSPTHAMDVAKVVVQFINARSAQQQPSHPLYHLCFNPYITWYQFAEQILNEAKLAKLPIFTERILPIPTSDFPTPARRPLNSRLATLYPNVFTGSP